MVKKTAYGAHQGLDGAMLVISGDVVVELLPQSLDDVVIRGVGWKKMQHDAPAQFFERLRHNVRLVDDVVIEHEMDAFRPTVPGTEER